MDVKDVLFMNKGDGENSYAHNSAFTQKVASMTKPALEETVRSLFSEESDFPGKRVVNVADLGCAAGPNTFFVMSTVLEAVEKICKELNFQIPEIQFYLNDLPGNDFNTLFNSLSGFCDGNKNLFTVPYFVMGAPGSFHYRLFPKNSMDLIHSSYSVHWLSQVPKLIGEGGVPLNKRKMYISETSPVIVREAYLDQFRHDFGSFLKCRSQEMVPNGRIILVISGRRTPDPATRESCYAWEVLADAISQMISQGLVDENKLDSFNVPYYTPSVEEVQELVDMERSFATERLEKVTIDVEDVYGSDEMKMAEAAAKSIRAFTEPIISQQFGEEIMDELYGEFVTKILLSDISKESIKIVSIVIVLKRIV